jgi:DNA ligase-1
MTLLAEIVRASQRVAATPARLAKVRELAALLKMLHPEEIGIAVPYLSGEIRQGKIGIGYSTLQAAAAERSALADSLSIADVDRCLDELAGIHGGGSAARREEVLRETFSGATRPEQEFLLRLLAGELRQGALAGVMLDAIAAAAGLPVVEIRRAAMYSNSLGAVAEAALCEGSAALGKFQLRLFSPVTPMLAQTATDVDEALGLIPGSVAFEWKMDGARIQVHKLDGDVRIYTRSLNEVTDAIPEIVELARGLEERSLVLIGENTLTGRSTGERYEALSAAVPAAHIMPRLITASPAAARAFYEAAVAAGHEGVMAKSLEAPYEAGHRGASWLKIKRVHTLDLVVLAAEWGHGRRTGKLSNLHLGALDPASGQYVMLGKTFKGLTDAVLEWQTRELLARETHRDRATVYVRPELVVEIAFSDLQASVRYPGGLALRLARVKRYRDDKGSADADTMDTVRTVYAAQSATLSPVVRDTDE